MSDLPAGWRLATIKEVARGPGEYGSGAAALPYDSDLPRYVRITDIGPDGSLNDSTLASIREVDAAPYMLQDEDLLFARSGATVGKTYLYRGDDGPCAYAGYVIKFSINHDVALPAYIQHWTHSTGYSRWVKRALRQAAQPNINAVEYGEHCFPLPPLEEQRRIAEILDALDAQILSIDNQLAKMDVRDAAIRASLIDARDVPSRPLSFYLRDRPRNGFSPVETDGWTGVKALGLGCLTPRGFRPAQIKDVPARDSRNAAATLADGDLLMSRANTRDLVGLAGIYRDIDAPCIYPDLMMRLRCNSDCLPEFLELLLRSPEVRRQIQAHAQGTSESMVKISSSIVRELRVRVPGLDVQKQVLHAVKMLQGETEQLREKLLKVLAVRSGLAEDLLTGRVRV